MFTSITPLSNPQRVADYLVRSAHADVYPRSPRPYPTFGVVRPQPSPPEGGDSTSSDYVPEMADCTGW